jgi:hypothetical protein
VRALNRFRIVSGGQTGVDRAALEWALANRIPHGGWCPKGRRAEDGIIPRQFQLEETGSPSYSVRTRRNVRDSDGTVIFSTTAGLKGGSARTAEFARKLGKPLLHLVASSGVICAGSRLKTFLKQHHIQVLNVAGPRASEEPSTAKFVQAVLSRTLKALQDRPGSR